MRVSLILASVVTGVGVLVSGCKEPPGSSGGTPGAAASAAGEKVLARIDDQVITVTDLQDRINHQAPYVRARYASPDRKKDLLDSLIQFEVMAAEARSRGYDRDPEVQRVMKQTMISEFIKRDFDSKAKPEDVPDADVEKYFKDHPQEFNRQEEVRVSQIFTKDKARAAKAAAEAKAAPAADQKAFRDLVTKYSEDEDSKQRGGDLTFFAKDSTMYPKPLVAAAFALKEVGDVSAPVQTERGFHVLKLTSKRPGFSRPLTEVKLQIQRTIYNEQRGKRMQEFQAEMRKKVKVETFPDKLNQVVVDTQTPAVAGMPGAGMPGAPPAMTPPAPVKAKGATP